MRLARLILINATLILILLEKAAAVNISPTLAANVRLPSNEIASPLTQTTRLEAGLSSRAHGHFCSWIIQPALCILLSADQFRPSKQSEKRLPVSGNSFTSKSGKFVLWRSNVKFANRADSLQMMSVAKSSICNPAAAPYDGATAVQVMKAPGVSAAIQPRADTASITHADRSETGNAELGFVAPSELTNSKTRLPWLVARESYGPMGPNAVLLESGANNKATRAFVDFLKGQKLHAIIARGWLRAKLELTHGWLFARDLGIARAHG
ncbi:molybdate ABC transporter substrate-binding protein, partial [Bradyrhizobium sp. Leo170]|uniref:molybdate ABC transporter substrate-binding protein n=2 Tax=unclassified Bradyrhizobium TaxID=2631580 RepID=UPI00102E420D